MKLKESVESALDSAQSQQSELEERMHKLTAQNEKLNKLSALQLRIAKISDLQANYPGERQRILEESERVQSDIVAMMQTVGNERMSAQNLQAVSSTVRRRCEDD